MSMLNNPAMPQAFREEGAGSGPLTTSRLRRTAIAYTAFCAVGLLPAFLQWAPSWQAMGLGLWFPGAGFIAVGGWATLITPLIWILFAASLIAWFGAGMVIAPLGVWLGAAGLAGFLAQQPPRLWAIGAVPLLTVAGLVYWRRKVVKRDLYDAKRLKLRQKFLPAALKALEQNALEVPEVASRELSEEDLAAARYVFDRALQPVAEFNGFDRIDQFQTASLRYQINHLSYGLSLLQCHYTPSFHGYLSQAQRNLTEKYLEGVVWKYWVYETIWGHLNIFNFDPADKDNIMLTGWFGLQVGLYASNTGDRRYEQKGSMTFELNRWKRYAHDYHSIQHSVVSNYDVADFCLYPCEPNWLYPICNFYGITSVVLHDRLSGADDAARILPEWLQRLDTEFTDAKGTIVGLRSSLTGFRLPFPSSEISYVGFSNTFIPERAKTMWAIARTEIGSLVTRDEEGKPYISLKSPPLDFGNYRRGGVGAYGLILGAAREMGDQDLAEAAENSLHREGGGRLEDGVFAYRNGSNLANAMAFQARIRGRDDFRNAVVSGPPQGCLRGPVLSEVKYPDVLVAKAFSDGEDLKLVLYPGAGNGVKKLRIARLVAGASYHVHGANQSALVGSAQGEAELDVDLDGRTEVTITPTSR